MSKAFEMRLGLISDIHGNSYALSVVLNELSHKKVDKIFCTGDVIGYYPYFNQVIEALRFNDVITILGNHETYFLRKIPISDARWKSYRLDFVEQEITPQNFEWLKSLENEIKLELDGTRFLFCHGSPWSVEEYIYPDNQNLKLFAELDADIIVMGHTHIAWHHVILGKTLINPGSCGQPRDYQPTSSYAIFDSMDKSLEFFRAEYDLQRLIKELKDQGFPKPLIDILYRTR